MCHMSCTVEGSVKKGFEILKWRVCGKVVFLDVESSAIFYFEIGQYFPIAQRVQSYALALMGKIVQNHEKMKIENLCFVCDVF